MSRRRGTPTSLEQRRNYGTRETIVIEWTGLTRSLAGTRHSTTTWPGLSASKERTGYFIHAKDRNIQWDQGRRTINILPPDSSTPENG